MNAIVKAWRRLKLRMTKRNLREMIQSENRFDIGDLVHVKDKSFDILTGGNFYTFMGTGEVVNAYYGYQMNIGHSWCYEVEYNTSGGLRHVDYREAEICMDAAWAREKKLKELGI